MKCITRISASLTLPLLLGQRAAPADPDTQAGAAIGAAGGGAAGALYGNAADQRGYRGC